MPPRETATVGARYETYFATPNDRELVVTRMFDAPRALVWAAFTDPRHLPHWHTGPEGFTMPVCEMDLRPGGSWRYVWRNPRGREFSAAGTYRDVDPPKRFVQVTRVDGEENTSTTTFTEEGGRTIVTVIQLFASSTARDQALPYARMGTASSHARLDAYLATLGQ
jgi:uncharacterized protein YndB with AHSA1/START domain